MWILHFLPDSFIQFIVHAILLAGMVGCVLSFFVINKVLRFFPPFASYYKIAQVASVVLLASGIYFEGGYTTEMQWRARVAEVEAKVAKAEAESKLANDKLDTKKEAKVKVIRGKALVVKQYIDREVTKYDSTCVIPQAVVKAHNAAARNEDTASESKHEGARVRLMMLRLLTWRACRRRCARRSRAWARCPSRLRDTRACE